MRSLIATPDGPALAETPRPTAGPGFVVVRVEAAALNRADLMMLSGEAHGFVGGAGLPLGLEWAGEITEIGPGVEGRSVGDRVMASSPGAFAEYVAVKAEWLHAIPNNLEYEQAAALPVAFQTMHDAIATTGELTEGQSVLILGASSAVGLMGLQIAKQLGAFVIGTSTNPQRRERLAEFGADLVLDTADPGWVKAVLKATKRRGADLTIDLLAGPLINDTIQATRVGGRLVNVGRMAGATVELDLEAHSIRRTRYIGTTFRTRTPAEITSVVTKAAADLLPAVADGKIRMPVDQVYAFDQYRDAFDRMAANRHFGKIVLRTKS